MFLSRLPVFSLLRTTRLLTTSNTLQETDVDFFKKLLTFSKEKKEPFVALLIDSSSNEILQYGFNRYPKNPIKHSEIDAYSSYSDRMSSLDAQPKGLTLYTTACPCPMCTAALVYSKIERVVYGSLEIF